MRGITPRSDIGDLLWTSIRSIHGLLRSLEARFSSFREPSAADTIHFGSRRTLATGSLAPLPTLLTIAGDRTVGRSMPCSEVNIAHISTRSGGPIMLKSRLFNLETDCPYL